MIVPSGLITPLKPANTSTGFLLACRFVLIVVDVSLSGVMRHHFPSAYSQEMDRIGQIILTASHYKTPPAINAS